MHTLQGKEFEITISNDGKGFITKKLPNKIYTFDVFDIIVNLLQAKGGKAKKGVGRVKNLRLGQPGCELDTVIGAIAYKYEGINPGKAVFDPVFVLAAILDWVEICYNERGYLELRNMTK